MHTKDYNHKKYRGIGNDVQDVMGELPRWTMWRGTLTVFLMFGFSIVTAFLMRYAETIKGAGSIVISPDVGGIVDRVKENGFRADSLQLLVEMKIGENEIRQITRGNKLIVLLDKDRTPIRGRILKVLKDERCVCNVHIMAQCYIPNVDVFGKVVERSDAGISIILEESSLADKVIRYASF
jgi:hypothetical protein